jgi:HB1, ASXL, restriction endonuclease HTH domain
MSSRKTKIATPAKKAKAQKGLRRAKDQPPKAARAEAPAGREPKKLSALAAAHRVLAESGRPMTCGEMIETMAAKGYWTSPAGKTPASTLYSSILRELKTKGRDSRFIRAERGRFALARKR